MSRNVIHNPERIPVARPCHGWSLVRSADQDAAETLATLAGRMAQFYAQETSYFDRAACSDQSRFYESFRPYLLQQIAARCPARIRVLELGAGRTCFPDWLERAGLRKNAECIAQDVTGINRAWLVQRCDEVLFGDAADGLPGGPYDVIFSTFAYEHFVSPARVLEASLDALAPGGLLGIVSPLYVAPGYVPPALRHLPRWQGLAASCFLAWQNLCTKLRGRPNFWIATEPALFAHGYRVDADAVHLVSSGDLAVSLGKRVERLPLRLPARGWRDWIWMRFLLLAALYRKR